MSEKARAINSIDERSTIQTDPMRGFRFRATFKEAQNVKSVFDPRVKSFSGGFSGISGLNISTAPIPYREGGYNTTVHNVPGLTTFEPVTFSRGFLYGNDSAITWMRGLFAASSGEGYNVNDTGSNGFRCNVKIELMDHPNAGQTTNTPRVGFFLQNAWISRLSYTDLNAGANELMYETMTLVHEGMTIAMLDANGRVTGNDQPSISGF